MGWAWMGARVEWTDGWMDGCFNNTHHQELPTVEGVQLNADIPLFVLNSIKHWLITNFFNYYL